MPVLLRLLPDGQTATAQPGEALIDLIDERSLAIPLGCRSAHCGSCLVRVRSGASALLPASDWERETLARLCGDADARLGCSIIITSDTNPERGGPQIEVELERLSPG